MLTVLSVAYPLAPVRPDTAGGAEQILGALDAALVAAGHRSLVIARADSRVAGELIPVPVETGPLDDAAKARAQARHARAIAMALERERVDLVHLHGIDFPAYLPPPGPPVLATLHLPPDWYPPEALRPARPRTFLNPVSAAQAQACPAVPAVLPAIPNGVPVSSLRATFRRRNFALFLGRICPEKGPDLAVAAAREAGVPILLAGEVFAYAEHERYFRERLRPLLDARCRFLGPVGPRAKRRLLTQARCLLVPSLAAETSSLVAREAAACGTPVIAFRAGALPETVVDGRTGFLVDDVSGMADAIRRANRIDADLCRAHAAEHFDLTRMTARYLALYEDLSRRDPAA